MEANFDFMPLQYSYLSKFSVKSTCSEVNLDTVRNFFKKELDEMHKANVQLQQVLWKTSTNFDNMIIRSCFMGLDIYYLDAYLSH